MHWVNWLYTIPVRVRSLLMRKRQDAELDEELRDHIERQTEDNLSRGMSEVEARLAARRTFGNFVMVREQTHESWAWTWLEQIWQDFRYALRSVRRAPLLSTVATLALGLGIGLNAGVFTLLNAMFLKAPTLIDPASFVQISPRYSGWSAERTDIFPSRRKTLRPFAAALTPSLKRRHGGSIPQFLNRETSTSLHCWRAATTFTFSESIAR